MGFLRRKKKAKTENTEPIPTDVIYEPLTNLLFDSDEIQRIEIPIEKIECETNEDLSKTKIIDCYCYELSHALVFFNPPSRLSRSGNSTTLLNLRISDIN